MLAVEFVQLPVLLVKTLDAAALVLGVPVMLASILVGKGGLLVWGKLTFQINNKIALKYGLNH